MSEFLSKGTTNLREDVSDFYQHLKLCAKEYVSISEEDDDIRTQIEKLAEGYAHDWIPKDESAWSSAGVVHPDNIPLNDGHRFLAEIRDILQADEQLDTSDIVAENFIATKCPLTQLVLEDPVSQKNHREKAEVCQHVFEKQAIMDYLRGRHHTKCPVAGCPKTVYRKYLEKDHEVLHHLRHVVNATEVSGAREFDLTAQRRL